MLHQIKAPQFYTELGSPKTVLNLPINGKIQGLLEASESFSSTFQGKGSLTLAMGKCLSFSVKIKVCQSCLSSP